MERSLWSVDRFKRAAALVHPPGVQRHGAARAAAAGPLGMLGCAFRAIAPCTFTSPHRLIAASTTLNWPVRAHDREGHSARSWFWQVLALERFWHGFGGELADFG